MSPAPPKSSPAPAAASPPVSDKKKKAEGPKLPVAEKTPRQTKRKKSLDTELLPDEEKRTSKRSRAPTAVYAAEDPDMAQILKTIKKQEEEEAKKGGDKSSAAAVKPE